ncbi:MAG: LysM peptidoglycan-binding domain-containing protein [Phascolarctobacterium sp.]|uniref:LysM peptidoglycan-binding domain-containing protein n=1 Tax=Phascolarctobacterium sp. TaxID=2049039 RepID=UPI0026DDBE68|nr:LysM peptidoglycan-binding domain-containing protein [Phascolarctobacterium sp.]MDO4920956.1 LysM peptidoglycan-binding domain-containing protein [Phascolarctobacterium sp.]
MLMKTAKVFLVIAALLAAMIFVTGGRGVKYAAEQRYHTVAAGQTVWGIATKYLPEQDRTRDVRELMYEIGKRNGLNNYSIQPGDVLVIPLEVEIKEAAEERGWVLLSTLLPAF